MFNDLLNISSRKKILIIAIAMLSILVPVALYKPHWLYSMIAALLSYIIIAVASFYSISKKITQKVSKAQNDISKEELAQNNIDMQDETSNQSSINNNDMKDTTSKPKTSLQKKDRYRTMLRLLDISKVSLGFELSFSFARLSAFIVMCFGFALLLYCNVFYPVAYILGIFIGVILVVGYLLCKY